MSPLTITRFVCHLVAPVWGHMAISKCVHRTNRECMATCPTYWGLNKMPDILQTTFSNTFSWKESLVSWALISLKFALGESIDNKSSLVWLMAWCQSSRKLLSTPVLTMFHPHIISLDLNESSCYGEKYAYGSGHKTAAVLLPGFAING